MKLNLFGKCFAVFRWKALWIFKVLLLHSWWSTRCRCFFHAVAWLLKWLLSADVHEGTCTTSSAYVFWHKFYCCLTFDLGKNIPVWVRWGGWGGEVLFFLRLVGATWVCDYIPVGSASIAKDSICRYLLRAFLFSLHFLLWLLLIPTVFDSGDSASSVNTPSPSLSLCRRDDSFCTLCPDGIKNFIASWFFLSMAAATVT